MRTMHPPRSSLSFAVALVALIVPLWGGADGASREPVHWVATWASAHQAPRFAGRGGRAANPPVPAAGAATPSTPPQPTVPAPTTPTPPVPDSFNNQTVRMIVRTSLGGGRIRVQFSNVFGTEPLELGAAHVARRSQGASTVDGTDRALTFGGASSITIPVGAVMLSDPVDLVVPPLSDLAISVFVPREVAMPSWHLLALQTTYISSEGNFTAAPTIAETRTRQAWYWVSEVDVVAPEPAGTIVAIGDSITDGDNSTPNANRSWPSVLAERVRASRSTAQLSVVNMGIAGNRVLTDGAGVSLLARFDRDVLSVAGVRWVLITEGINDIGGIFRGTPVTEGALIGALKQMIERAHTHKIKVIGGTLTPFGGANYYTDAGESVRIALNAFIRTSPELDGFVDFDAATRDATNEKQFRLGFNNRDHLHPNDAGYQAMADAVQLSLFKK